MSWCGSRWSPGGSAWPERRWSAPPVAHLANQLALPVSRRRRTGFAPRGSPRYESHAHVLPAMVTNAYLGEEENMRRAYLGDNHRARFDGRRCITVVRATQMHHLRPGTTQPQPQRRAPAVAREQLRTTHHSTTVRRRARPSRRDQLSGGRLRGPGDQPQLGGRSEERVVW